MCDIPQNKECRIQNSKFTWFTTLQYSERFCNILVSLKVLDLLPFNFFVGWYGEEIYICRWLLFQYWFVVRQTWDNKKMHKRREEWSYIHLQTDLKKPCLTSLRHGLTMSSDKISTNAQIGQLRDQSRPAKWIFHDRRTKGVIDVQNCRSNSKLHKNLISLQPTLLKTGNLLSVP